MTRSSLLLKLLPALAVVLYGALPCPARQDEDLVRQVDRIFDEHVSPGSPGYAAAIFRDGRKVLHRCYGLASLEYSAPLAADTVFYIGSLAKQFTAACLASLVLDGSVSTEDSIRTYLPELPEAFAPVKVRHLLHHTSGIRDYFTLLDVRGDSVLDDYYTPEDIHRLLCSQTTLNFEPGSEFSYSNSNYFLIARIVEAVGGSPVGQLARRRIFDPLGMIDSRFVAGRGHVIERRADAYELGEGEFRRLVANVNIPGAGGMFSTVDDLGRWSAAFCDPEQELAPVFKLMRRRGRLDDGSAVQYCWGLMPRDFFGLQGYMHTGALGGYHSFIIHFPETALSIVCLTNSHNTPRPIRLAEAVARAYLADELRIEPETESSGKVEPYSLPAQRLNRLLGFYRNPESGEVLKLFLWEEEPTLHLAGKVFALEAVDELHLRSVSVRQSLSIEIGDDSVGRPKLKVRAGESASFRFESFSPDWPSPAEFIGVYRIQELSANLQILFSSDTLFLKDKRSERALERVDGDVFLTRNRYLTFERAADGSVRGFRLDASNCRGLRFTRLD